MSEMVSIEKEGDNNMNDVRGIGISPKDVYDIEIRPKKENEISLWAIVTIEMNPFATGKQFELQEIIFSVITESEGLVGAYPVLGTCTLFLFKSEELANKARKTMQESGLPVGKDVTECFVPKADLNVFKAKNPQ